MNIFALDTDPHTCATYHCNKHVVKMILEHAQLMCTAHHLHPSGTYNIQYKQTHTNHPCAKWVRSSLDNYKWLYEMTKHLNDEYKFRYDKSDHKSWLVIRDLPYPDIPSIGLTPFAQAMPDHCKSDNPITAYRTYYKLEKQRMLQFGKRNIPSWLTEEICIHES